MIVWRAKTVGDVPYLLGYVGGENIYDMEGGQIQVHWLTTADGLTLEPVVPGQPVVLTGGGSYTVYNDTSPLDGPDLPWNEAQVRPTVIYRIPLAPP